MNEKNLYGRSDTECLTLGETRLTQLGPTLRPYVTRGIQGTLKERGYGGTVLQAIHGVGNISQDVWDDLVRRTRENFARAN